MLRRFPRRSPALTKGASWSSCACEVASPTSSCFFVIIVNIVLINFGYNIATDVKILSLVLLTLDCFLITYYWRRYRLLLLPEAALDELSEPRKGGKASADCLTNVRLLLVPPERTNRVPPAATATS